MDKNNNIETFGSEYLISNKNWDKDEPEERASHYKQIKPNEVMHLIDRGVDLNRLYRIELPSNERYPEECHIECVKDFPIGWLKQDIIYCCDRDDVIYLMIEEMISNA